MLIFTPGAAQGDSLERLEAALPHVDAVQVRPKPLGDRLRGAEAGASVTRAREAFDLALGVADLLAVLTPADRPLLFVNDRIDVARALEDRGVDGAHVGADDTPADVARAVLGEGLLLGLSTHTMHDVAESLTAPIDLIGFGPVFATATKGYGSADAAAGSPRVMGPESAWVAAETSPVPVFAIGGITATNADQLDRVGRAAVSSAILGAQDPERAAATLRGLLTQSHTQG